MKPLSGRDALSLHVETPATRMHVGSLHLFDLPDAYRGDFHADVRRHVAERLHLAPLLRRNLRTLALDVANPVWVEDSGVDLDYHVWLVIMLGTPFTGHPKATNAWRLFELVAGHKIGPPEIHEPLRNPPPVPTTSIYSRPDGVVACCIEKEGPRTGNIEIEASHFGLGLNPASLYAIADRLAQPAGQWRPFDRSIGLRAWIYRDPRRRARF